MHEDSVNKIRGVLMHDIEQLRKSLDHYLPDDSDCFKKGVMYNLGLVHGATERALENMTEDDGEG